MKKFTLWAAIPAAFLLCLAGCGGGNTQQNPGSNEKLTLEKPSDETVKVGDSAKVTVKIKRKDFGGPVEITFSDIPEGITIDPASAKLSGSDDSSTFTLKAGNNAKVGDHTVKVTAKAESMNPSQTFKVTVKDKG